MTISGGTVTAIGGQNAAGIGSSQGGTAGTVTISGGTVTAEGGENGAGIGGGQSVSGGTVTIKDGTVIATGGQDAAGIGGGKYGTGGTVTISGGVVTAEGSTKGAGIGGGDSRDGGTVIISGGNVTATGGSTGSAGIGGGTYGTGGNVTISGGVVNAAGSGKGAGIGGGDSRDGGSVTISGGIVTATGGSAGIGGGYGGAGGTVTISGGTVTAAGGENGAGIGGSNGAGGEIVINGGNVKAVSGAGGVEVNGTLTDGNGNGVSVVTIKLGDLAENHTAVTGLTGVGSYGLNDVYTLDTNMLYFYLPKDTNPAQVEAGGEVYSGTLDENRTGTFYTKGVSNPVIELSTLNVTLKLKKEETYKLYSINGGVSWKVYEGSITLKDGETKAANQTVSVESGDHDVILENATLTGNPSSNCPFHIASGASVSLTLIGENQAVTDQSNWAGIQVNEGAGLTITAASTGNLTAKGGSSAAGIGSAGNGTCGTVIIKGGKITAAGGQYAAGIGSGQSGTGGIVTIEGGTVIVTGGQDAAGIGGGQFGTAGSVMISGGTVNAEGSGKGAGIGSGDSRENGTVLKTEGTVVISGGVVNAIGTYKGAGIGGGDSRAGGTVAISGGIVTAAGGSEGAAGIGGGYYGAGGKVAISGGTVIAEGGSNGAVIGGGYKGAGGEVAINGGNVKAVSETSGAVIGAGVNGGDNGTLTDGSGQEVSLVTIELRNVTDSVRVTSLTGAESYGMNDVYTLDTNKLYVYLPAQTNPTAAAANGELYTGVLNENRRGVFSREQDKFISVEVAWGAMDFTYASGTWNPETLTYEGSGWLPGGSMEEEYMENNKITVTNNSTEAVSAHFSFAQADGLTQAEDLAGSFWNRNASDGTETELEGASLLLYPPENTASDTGDTAEVWLRLNSSKPTDSISGTLGAITVMIESVS